MNLSAYDSVEQNLDKTKTWVYPTKKILYSREMIFHKYYILAKRFSPVTKTTSYYIIFVDNKQEGKKCILTNVDEFGRIKLRINSIWNNTSLKHIKTNTNINIEHIEHTDDGDIYYLDI